MSLIIIIIIERLPGQQQRSDRSDVYYIHIHVRINARIRANLLERHQGSSSHYCMRAC